MANIFLCVDFAAFTPSQTSLKISNSQYEWLGTVWLHRPHIFCCFLGKNKELDENVVCHCDAGLTPSHVGAQLRPLGVTFEVGSIDIRSHHIKW